MTTTELESRLARVEAELAQLKAQVERSAVLTGIKRGQDAADAGHMAPAREVLEHLRKKHNIAGT
jgi:hypothetical protein